MTPFELLNKIIRVRKKLMQMNRSGKNVMATSAKLQKIESYVQAYGQRLSKEQWKNFIIRNYDDIMYLIPGNGARQNYVEQLNSFLL
jgi:hypothetical protein